MKTDINLHLKQLLDMDDKIEQMKAENKVRIQEAERKYQEDIAELKGQIETVRDEAKALKENRISQINSQIKELQKANAKQIKKADDYFEEKKEAIVNQLYNILFEIEE